MVERVEINKWFLKLGTYSTEKAARLFSKSANRQNRECPKLSLVSSSEENVVKMEFIC